MNWTQCNIDIDGVQCPHAPKYLPKIRLRGSLITGVILGLPCCEDCIGKMSPDRLLDTAQFKGVKGYFEALGGRVRNLGDLMIVWEPLDSEEAMKIRQAEVIRNADQGQSHPSETLGVLPQDRGVPVTGARGVLLGTHHEGGVCLQSASAESQKPASEILEPVDEKHIFVGGCL